MSLERVRELETVAQRLFDEVEDSMHQVEEYPQPQASDSPEDIQARMLFLGSVDDDLSYLYRQALKLQRKVDSGRQQAKSNLEDKRMEEIGRRNFKLPGEFPSRTEVDLKLRARSLEESHESNAWDVLFSDTRYLVDTLKSYQFQIKRQRTDIDTRLRYFYF